MGTRTALWLRHVFRPVWGTSDVSPMSTACLPEHTVYSGPQSAPARRVTLRTLRAKHARGEPLTMVTAYDYPSAVHVDAAGIDMLLVGDSVGMVVHGHDTTLPVTLEDMLLHCRAVSRGARRPLLVGDLPFGSYEASPEMAVRSAVRLLKEGTMDAVKLEGGGGAREAAARAVVAAGVAVMGHCGLLPQSISVLGGFRPQGQSAAEALRVVREARALQDAGCFAVVLECVPPVVAAAATSQLDIPTIGIGAGPHCSGQVLVYHDLLGMMQHPHHAKVTPKFCKQYAAIGTAIQGALQQYREEVAAREFPSAAFSPYRIADEEVAALERALHSDGMQAAAQAVAAAREAHNATYQVLAVVALQCVMAWAHELSHFLAHRRLGVNRALSLISNCPLVVPMATAFRKYHQEHHSHLGVDGWDVDLPTRLEASYICNLAAKLLWTTAYIAVYGLRPIIIKPKPVGMADMVNLALVLGFDAAVLYLAGVKALAYLLLGTLLGGGLHPMAGHLIAEHYMFLKGQETYSYYGPLNALTYNVGFHNEHHDFPQIPHTRLHKLHAIAPEFYSGLAFHTSWSWVTWTFLTDAEVGPWTRVRRRQRGGDPAPALIAEASLAAPASAALPASEPDVVSPEARKAAQVARMPAATAAAAALGKAAAALSPAKQAQASPPCRALAARLAATAAPQNSPASAAKARAARTHLPGAFADVTNVGGSASRARLRAQKAIVA
ncbi:hypothetical protein WJX81_002217 [Elliptochloris bilobata]|uniref:3-methyl-2-oxobutanoate hydroxymethyltransferase n=1 Tax=Elliptochloris bilobata TaxID=381761 RepID=A0AAW1QYX7_9CHLO